MVLKMSGPVRKERVLVWVQEGHGHVDDDDDLGSVFLERKCSFIFFPIFSVFLVWGFSNDFSKK